MYSYQLTKKLTQQAHDVISTLKYGCVLVVTINNVDPTLGCQRWNVVEIRRCFNVEIGSIFQRWNMVEITTLFQRWKIVHIWPRRDKLWSDLYFFLFFNFNVLSPKTVDMSKMSKLKCPAKCTCPRLKVKIEFCTIRLRMLGCLRMLKTSFRH